MTQAIAKELVSSTGGHYYAYGRDVFKAPVTRVYSDGSQGWGMGFKICVCDEFVDGAAEHIAIALNEYEKITPPKEPS